MHNKQLIEKLVYDIASRFDTSINLAEAQSVVGAAPGEDLDWLCDCFEEIGLVYWNQNQSGREGRIDFYLYT